MKKFLSILFVTFIGLVTLAPEQKAEAQVIYGAYCCDAYNVRRCTINPSPVGSACYCYGQGYGWTCI
jgi:hypothetical protein